MDKHEKDLEWSTLCRFQKMSEDFMEKHVNLLDWVAVCVSHHQTLSEPFIRKYHEKLDMDLVSSSQKLSENMIREYEDRVNWRNITRFQSFDENFAMEFHKIDWCYLFRYKLHILSDEFYSLHYRKITCILLAAICNRGSVLVPFNEP
ncbi:hypothetical protein TNCV_4064701 [Trichonephila clavipes]|nr:hypothetical protein TNCV_4064701 [Trichonephila clavipes]